MHRPAVITAATAGVVVALMAASLPAVAEPRDAREARVQARLDAIRDDATAMLRFMTELPKGGDLHQHLSGTVYAESLLRWAAEDGLCITRVTFVATAPPCTDAQIPAAAVLTDTTTQAEVIGAWSMRQFVPSLSESGHNHFFAAFGKFGAVLSTVSRNGDALAEVLNDAGSDRVVRVETMLTANSSAGSQLSSVLQAQAPNIVASPAGFEQGLAIVQAAGLDTAVATAQQQTTEMTARAEQVMGCGTTRPALGCSVDYGFITQANRNSIPSRVFAQFAISFALADRDPRWDGVNLVAPEDGIISLRDYTLHMQMVRFFSGKYPNVRISLHAGELVPGLVPFKDLEAHIRQAVLIAGADRIGHGVAIREQRRSAQLLRLMRERGISVEIALTSNEQILEVTPQTSQFPVYREAGIPITLATDDAGVARIDLTHEYAMALDWFDLDYRDLKELSYVGVQEAFVTPQERRTLRERLDRAFAAFEMRWQLLS